MSASDTPPPPPSPPPPEKSRWRRLSTGKKAAVIIAGVFVLGTIASLLGYGEEEDDTTAQTDTSSVTSTTQAGRLKTTSALRAGDCFQEPDRSPAQTTTTNEAGSSAEEPEVFSVVTVDCSEPHDFEVTGLRELDDADDYPPVDELVALAERPCERAFRDHVGSVQNESAHESLPLFLPSSQGWAAGSRSVVCAAGSPELARLAGSVRRQGPSTLVQSDDLVTGDCYLDRAEGASGFVRVDCTAPHDNEIIGFHELDDGPYPGSAGVREAGESGCDNLFETYVGETTDGSELQADVAFFPTEAGWEAGDRVVTCVAYHDDLSRIEGSAKGRGPS